MFALCKFLLANFIGFPVVKKCENRLRFDKVIESLKVGTFPFLRHSVYLTLVFYKRNLKLFLVHSLVLATFVSDPGVTGATQF